MSDVPSDLFREILLRLPAESLIRFRAVCKAWRRTIDDPSFIKSHTTNQQSYSCTQLLIRDSIFCGLYSLSLDSLNIDAADQINGQQTVDLTRIKNLVRSGVLFLRDLPTTSCHGLILISHSNLMKTWVIWNPLTQEFRRLSDPDDFGITGIPSLGVGLGYDYATDDYKVVRIDVWGRDGKIYRTLVYSLKSGSWKATQDCPQDSILRRRAAGVYLNGALHWISENGVIKFDLVSEEYSLVPLPSLSGQLGEPLDMYIDALDGCLLLSCYYTSEPFWNEFEGEECLQGWMMNAQMEWIKLFSFGVQGSAAVLSDLRPVAYLKSKGCVFLQHYTHFYCIDIQMDSRKKVTIHGLPECFTSQNFHGSLVRLESKDGGAGVSSAAKRGGVIWRKKKRVQTRLKLSVTIDDLCHSNSRFSNEGGN